MSNQSKSNFTWPIFFVASVVFIILLSFASMATRSTAAANGGNAFVFLPLIQKPPEVSSIQFGYAQTCDEVAGNYAEAPVTTPPGIKALGLDA